MAGLVLINSVAASSFAAGGAVIDSDTTGVRSLATAGGWVPASLSLPLGKSVTEHNKEPKVLEYNLVCLTYQCLAN